MEMKVFNRILGRDKDLLDDIYENNPMNYSMSSPVYPEVRKKVSYCRPGKGTIQYKIEELNKVIWSYKVWKI